MSKGQLAAAERTKPSPTDMWVSSFASAAADSADVRVRAHIWGSDRLPFAREPSGAHAAAAFGVQDSLTLVATGDVALLRRLRAVNGSFVAVSHRQRTHIGRLVLAAKDEVYAGEDGQESDGGSETFGDVTLSPLLAFNLGISLHAIKTDHVTVSVSVLSRQ